MARRGALKTGDRRNAIPEFAAVLAGLHFWQKTIAAQCFQPLVCDLFNLARCLMRLAFFLAILASAYLSTEPEPCSGLGIVLTSERSVVVAIYYFSFFKVGALQTGRVQLVNF